MNDIRAMDWKFGGQFLYDWYLNSQYGFDH